MTLRILRALQKRRVICYAGGHGRPHRAWAEHGTKVTRTSYVRMDDFGTDGFYKIVLVQDQTKWKAIAFVMLNQDFERPYQFETYIKSIDWIEQQTGIEFMPNIDLRERRTLKSVAASMWP